MTMSLSVCCNNTVFLMPWVCEYCFTYIIYTVYYLHINLLQNALKSGKQTHSILNFDLLLIHFVYSYFRNDLWVCLFLGSFIKNDYFPFIRKTVALWNQIFRCSFKLMMCFDIIGVHAYYFTMACKPF